MSSIYRKGRDGYFYYQTYVYNPKSKKKDKKIFHALGTKNSDDAKEKQIILDEKYETNSDIEHLPEKEPYVFGLNTTIAIIISTIILTIFIGRYLNPKVVNERHKSATDNINSKTVKDKINIVNQSQIIDSDKHINSLTKDYHEKDQIQSNLNEEKNNLIISEYNIERVDTLSDAFNQGKIYVTVSENSEKEGQRLLCSKIAKRFSEFSNIIICVYANNQIGKNLAQGNNRTISLEEKKRYWLAMYTYNPVEGEYFDDNPGSYLGI